MFSTAAGGLEGLAGGAAVGLGRGERLGSTPDATRKSGAQGGDGGQRMEND